MNRKLTIYLFSTLAIMFALSSNYIEAQSQPETKKQIKYKILKEILIIQAVGAEIVQKVPQRSIKLMIRKGYYIHLKEKVSEVLVNGRELHGIKP